MAQRERAWLREVYLCCGAQRWVYARTVIPAGTLHGELQQLTRLGTRPLGEFIFADPTLERGDVQLGTVQDATSFAGPTDSVASLQGRLWGRRAVFRLQGKPLLVTEFFLPDMVSTLESGK
jgi:chorismate--pyruvate lyase